MTLQIAMFATDGILLAGDTRWMNESGVRTREPKTKFRINESKGIAIACARNMETATHIAETILADLKEQELASPRLAIELIAGSVLPSANRKQIECLIVFTRPRARLFHLQVEIMQFEAAPHCYPISGGASIAGDHSNPAVFWTERYYRLLPMQALVPLAAQTICQASELNNAAIDGLEILLCNSAGIKRLSDDSILQLQARAKELAGTFEDMMLSGPQQFTYAPDVIG